jgi:N-acetylglutamate synthase-like GNAT family acetyltransferase
MSCQESEAMIIRKATDSDKDHLQVLINRAFRVEDFFKYEDRMDRAELNECFKSGEFLLAEEEGKLVGCIYLEIEGDRGYFGTLSIQPELQGKGLGKRLMQEAETRAKLAGCHFMDIQIVNVREELPGYYGKYGYKQSSTGPFPRATKIPCFFVGMTKELS